MFESVKIVYSIRVFFFYKCQAEKSLICLTRYRCSGTLAYAMMSKKEMGNYFEKTGGVPLNVFFCFIMGSILYMVAILVVIRIHNVEVFFGEQILYFIIFTISMQLSEFRCGFCQIEEILGKGLAA